MGAFIPNSFQVPNVLIDELMCSINPNALKCYLIIIRKTTGWHKEWDKISTTQLQKFTGIKKKETIYKAIAELEKLNLIESVKELGKLTSYRLVPIKGTSTENSNKVVPIKGTTTSTDKGDSTKDTKTKDKYTKFIEYLKDNVDIKTKVTSTKEGKVLFNNIEDKRKLIMDYINHQKEKGEYSQRITAYMLDYETVHNKKQELKENQILKDGVVHTSISM